MSALYDEISPELEMFQVPGASWAVIDGGEVVDVGCTGVVQAGEPAAVVPGTLFQACSISKPVAVFAMLRLVDRGLLDLDEDVNRRLTSWQVPPTGLWQPVVTLRQLASHSAGLTVHGFPGYRRGTTLPTTVQILDGTAPTNTFGVRVDIVPGTQFRYSGGGTVVLQQLLEDVTGTPFQQLAQELVLEPIGMSDSDYAQPLPPALHDRAATAHDELGRPVPGRWHSYPELAAAGLWTTPTDLAKFAIAVQQTYAGADGALLSPGLARDLLTPHIAATARIGGLSHLGLGLFLGNGGERFGHSGGNEGYCCHLLAYRDTGQGAAVMTNGANGSWVVQRAFAALARAYGWNDYPQEVDEPELPTDETLENLAGAYKLNGRVSLDVAAWGSGLVVTFGGQPPLRFGASSATRFAAVEVDAELELRDNGSRLVFIQGGAELDCTRE
ncbi:serine hydrolase domain-containing protein [Kribbella swartbergensis]